MITQFPLMNTFILACFSIYTTMYTSITIECTKTTRITKCIAVIFRSSIENTVSKVHNIKIMIILKSAVKNNANMSTHVYKRINNALVHQILHIFSSKINLNHRFIGLPQTFSVLNRIFYLTQFPTSGSSKVNKPTCFWCMRQPFFDQCFLNEKWGVISKFLHSLVRKDLYFQIVTLFQLCSDEKYGFFEFAKSDAFFKRGSSTCQSLSRAVYRTLLYAPY